MENQEKLRRTVMFAAGNNAGLVRDAQIYGADSVIYDLEDSVSIYEKDSARQLVFHALTRMRRSCEVGVRINHISTPWGAEDLAMILAAKPDYIRLPKGESADEIRELDAAITKAEEQHGFEPGFIKIMAVYLLYTGLIAGVGFLAVAFILHTVVKPFKKTIVPVMSVCCLIFLCCMTDRMDPAIIRGYITAIADYIRVFSI